MSAELFGTSLLQEVYEESLSSLLSDLRTIHNPRLESSTGLAELDKIIDTFRYPSSAHDLVQTIPPDIDVPFDSDLNDEHEYNDDTSPRRNHAQTIPKPKPIIINISQTSNSSTAATSLLLSHCTANAILSPSQAWRHGAVIHIDCLNTFDTATLYSVTQSLIQKADSSSSVKTTEQLVKTALSHVHIIPCSSTLTLLQHLKDLPSYLLNPTAHNSSSRPLTLLIITGLNHFTWQDRFTADLARLNQINDHNPQDPLPTQILSELRYIQSTFDCTVVYTTTSSNVYNQPSDNTDSNTSPAQDIYASSALLTLRAVRTDPPQFAPQMSLAECLRDRERRMEATRNVRFWVTAVAGGLSERRGREKMGFGMKKDGEGWVFES